MKRITQTPADQDQAPEMEPSAHHFHDRWSAMAFIIRCFSECCDDAVFVAADILFERLRNKRSAANEVHLRLVRPACDADGRRSVHASKKGQVSA